MKAITQGLLEIKKGGELELDKVQKNLGIILMNSAYNKKIQHAAV